MNVMQLAAVMTQVLSPVTGDKVRPWIAAVILIVSVIVLIGVFVFGKRDKDSEDSSQEEYKDED